MTASSLALTRQIFRKFVVASVVGLIGLFVGAACVVLPIAIPFAVVGIAAGLLLWVLPDLQTVPATMARRMFSVFLFSALCIPAYYTLIVPGLPWIAARRVALIAFAVPTVIVLAGSSLFRRRLVEIMRVDRFTYACILVFLVSLLVSTVMSVQLSTSISTFANMVTWWFLPFIGVMMLLRDRQDVERVMKLLVICVLFDFVIGFIEFYRQKSFLIFLLPASLRAQIVAANPLYIALLQGQVIRNGLYRAASTFNISLSWGEMSAMLAPIGLHFLVHGTTRRDRIFGCAGFFLAFGSIICSGARGAYVGFIVAIIVYAMLWPVRHMRTRPGSLTGSNALVILTTASIILILAVLFVGPVHRFVLGTGGTQGSTDARWAEWALAKPKILRSPLWGYGPGTSGDVIGYYSFGSETPTVDSYIMTGLVDFGVIGFLAFALMLFGAAFLAFRRYLFDPDPRSEVGAALGCSLTAFIVYRITLSQMENMSTMSTVLALTLFYFGITPKTPVDGRLSSASPLRPMGSKSAPRLT